MIYVILFIAVLVISFFLAYRSMSSFQQYPSKLQSYSLYLIKNIKELNFDTLEKLHNLSLSSQHQFSLEVLFKGNQAALALYAPATFAQATQLQLLEIEDYLESNSLNLPANKTTVNEIYGWVIAPKNNPKKILNVSQDFLRMIDLEASQKFFWQMVLLAVKNGQSKQYQATIRVMVAESDPIKRVELAKAMDREIEQHTGLVKNPKASSASFVFEAYSKRTLVPKEVSPFILQIEEVFNLLGKLTH